VNVRKTALGTVAGELRRKITAADYAIATGVTLEAPVLAAPVGALAAAVGASRVVTGVAPDAVVVDAVPGYLPGWTRPWSKCPCCGSS
jgi:hypothetical protein